MHALALGLPATVVIPLTTSYTELYCASAGSASHRCTRADPGPAPDQRSRRLDTVT